METTCETRLEARKFLLSLFADLADDKNYEPRFKANHRGLHEFFWRVKQDAQTGAFVQDFLFDTNGNYPHCEQIDELLQEFQLSGVLSRPNPTYKFNDIRVKKSPYSDEFKNRLTPTQVDAYGGAVAAFKRELGVAASK
ncbi:MAG: hypothetical protein ABSG86_11425 [Thermoguttaceae bacterium]|jgi:hypothetical protein